MQGLGDYLAKSCIVVVLSSATAGRADDVSVFPALCKYGVVLLSRFMTSCHVHSQHHLIITTFPYAWPSYAHRAGGDADSREGPWQTSDGG